MAYSSHTSSTGYDFNSKKIVYCIVKYDEDNNLEYYTGYYMKEDKGYFELAKPYLTKDFDHALKLPDRKEAERILTGLDKPNWKVEEHSYF